MKAPLNLADNHTKIWFGVFNEVYHSSMKIDPRFGKFEAFLVKVDQVIDSETGTDDKTTKELPVYEMTEDEKSRHEIHDVHAYSIDLQEVELSGLQITNSRTYL